MDQFPLVSIVIPVYNVEDYLQECVESVLRQTYQHYEIILVDDGSTDSSGQMCDDYLRQDDRIKVVHQSNGGLSAARNRGLRESNGEYIYFLDSDDYIENICIEHAMHCILENNADFVFFDGTVFFDGCEEDDSFSNFVRESTYSTDRSKEVLFKLLKSGEYRTPVQFLVIKKSYMVENNLSFYEGILHEDELFTFLVFNANGIVCHCHEALYARRIRPGSIMTSSKALKRFESFMIIYRELEQAYSTGKAEGPATDMYLVRTAKGIWGKYQQFNDDEKSLVDKEYQQFRRNVLSHNGYGDMKLKIKCSDGVRNFWYRAQYKLERMIKR